MKKERCGACRPTSNCPPSARSSSKSHLLQKLHAAGQMEGNFFSDNPATNGRCERSGCFNGAGYDSDTCSERLPHRGRSPVGVGGDWQTGQAVRDKSTSQVSVVLQGFAPACLWGCSCLYLNTAPRHVSSALRKNAMPTLPNACWDKKGLGSLSAVGTATRPINNGLKQSPSSACFFLLTSPCTHHRLHHSPSKPSPIHRRYADRRLLAICSLILSSLESGFGSSESSRSLAFVRSL